MKSIDYSKVLLNIPRQTAFFEVVNVPRWAEDLVGKGDEVYYSLQSYDLVTVKRRAGINLPIGSLKFLRYDKHPAWRS